MVITRGRSQLNLHRLKLIDASLDSSNNVGSNQEVSMDILKSIKFDKNWVSRVVKQRVPFDESCGG